MMITLTIEELALSIKTGKTPSTRDKLNFENGEYNWFTPGDFKTPKILKESKRKITDYAAKNNAVIYQPDTILITCIGDIGNAGIIKKESSANQQITGVVVNTDIITSEFFLYWVKANKQRIRDEANQAVVPIINNKGLKRIKVTFPSDLPTQNKIVAILDKASALIQKRAESIALLDELLRAQFLEMFGDPVIANKHKSIELKYYLNKIQIGPFGSQLHRKDYISGGIPLVNPINIISKEIIPNNEITLTERKYRELPNYHLSEGDIIMARRGEMGRCGIITLKEDGWFCGTGSLFLRPKNKIYSLFLLYSLTEINTIEYLNLNAKGVTMKNLNKKIISNIPIIKCNESLFIKFNTLYYKNKEKSAQLKQSQAQLQTLFNSILQRAFKGQLNFNIDVELDALLTSINIEKETNDITGISKDIAFLQRLADRLDTQKFETPLQYQQAKHVAFQMLKEGIVEQVYDEDKRKVKIKLA